MEFRSIVADRTQTGLALHFTHAYFARMEIEALKTLVLVAQNGSFAASARTLDLDPSSVSRAVANAEAALGFRVFQRSTRKLSVTEEGARYLQCITPLLEEFDRAAELSRGASQKPQGTLKLTASVAFAHECVVPHLSEFMERYPELAVELLPTDANIDLTEQGVDLAIRLAAAPVGDLINTRLMRTNYRVCASPAYVAQHPNVDNPRVLSQLDCLCFALPEYRTRWRFLAKGQDPFEVPISGKLVIANALSLKRAALDGMGTALLADWLIKDNIRNGTLVDLFPEHECTATEFDTSAWALYPSRSYLPQKVRVMIDFLREKLKA